MVFYLIGLGLGDPRDVTVRGLEVIRGCERIYLEAYTSILSGGREALEKFYERKVILADREQVEQASDELFVGAKSKDVALLVVGDPLGATTHTDLKLRAHQLGVPVEIISNASILNAVGSCGLQLHHFGETVSIPFWQDGWEPVSFCDKINKNLRKRLHTLCLLDIKVKEQSLENLLRGRKIFEPPRYMRVAQAVQQLMAVVERHTATTTTAAAAAAAPPGTATNAGMDSEWLLSEWSLCVGLARVGTPTQQIVKGKLKDLVDCDLGEPLHSLIICGECDPIEEEALGKLTAHFTGEPGQGVGGGQQRGVFHMIGLGLGQPGDVTVKGLEAIKGSCRVFLEGLTAVVEGGIEAMQALYDKPIAPAERERIEANPDGILDCTREGDVALLVIGDPLSAATHIRLLLCALKKRIPINVIHNASIMNAVGCCGLQLYSFGETVSIPLWGENWRPDGFYDKISSNLENGWHTLCLLDAKTTDLGQDRDARRPSQRPDFMTVSQGAAQILEVMRKRSEEGRPTPLTPENLVIGLARVGTKTQLLKACSLQELMSVDLGESLHCLVVVGETHPMEDEYINMFR